MMTPSKEATLRPGQPDQTMAKTSPQKKELTIAAKGELVPSRSGQLDLPPILAGNYTPAVEAKVRSFYFSVAEIFERWVTRRESRHTQRAYRQDIFALVKFLRISWPKDATSLLRVSVADIQAWRDHLIRKGAAPKTLNRRVSSVSSLFKYLAGVASEMRLPITVPNPAHAQFIGRSAADPLYETKSLSATRARQLMGLPEGEELAAYRDRAILKFYLYSGARLGTGCRLKVSDFHFDQDEATIRLREKGNRTRTVGLHFAAAEAIQQYLDAAGITRGAIFRPMQGSRSKRLANRHLSHTTMYLIILGYLEQLPRSMKQVESADGTVKTQCVYTPHSLRATTATLLLDAGVDIAKVQELLGHRHITTTQIYDKRRRTTAESASHDVPI